METRTTMTALALVLGLGLAGASAGAADTVTFNELDADGDGVVSRDEFMAYGDETYAVTAEEAGGRVTTVDYNEKVKFRGEDPDVRPVAGEEEYVTEEQMRADYEETFGTLDVDRDEALTEEELAESDIDFDALDADDDGVVSRDEFMAYGEEAYAELSEEFGERVSTIDYNEKVKLRQEEPVDVPADESDEFITEEQARMDYEDTFERLDEDGDGVLTEDELSS